MVNKKRLIDLAQRLIRVDSQNPPGNESDIARFVKDYLFNLGVKTKIYEFKRKRSNIVCIIKGKKQQSLLITPHLDTVPAGKSWTMNPLEAKICNHKLYGLGATDCKVNLACALEAINSIIEDKIGLDYNLIFAATADEECGSDLGLTPLLEKQILKPDAAVVLDSDDFEIIVTQKGLMHLKVKIQGRRAHGAYTWMGSNAIDMAINILKEIKTYKFKFKKNRYLRPPTLNIGTIRGGDKVNIVADWCEFELDFRFLPGMSGKDLLAILRRTAKKYAKKFQIEIEGIQAPYSIDERHPLITCLKNAMKKNKIKPMVKGSEGATVVTFFQDINIPAVATGFGSSGCAHIADEFVKIDNLYKGAVVLERFLKDYRFG
jgi:succinyl-diaminopimelate desuccinylase